VGVRWKAELSQDPARWRSLAGAALDRAEGLSLAEREKVVSSHLAQASKDGWKLGLKPALDAAAKEGKLLLFFQLVGDLDFEGC
jgi:hypothetical protein